jgi:hypothetical protein
MSDLPYEIGDALDYIVLGTDGQRSPGVVELSGHDRVDKWDNQSAKGTAGSSSKLNGADIGSFTAKFKLRDDRIDPEGGNDFTRWDVFQRLIDSTVSGPTPVALPIYHPDLARNKYTEVVRASMGGMVHDGTGGATVTVKFQEYKPPKPKPAVKAKAKPSAPGANEKGKAPDPNAAAKAELASLLAEAKKP